MYSGKKLLIIINMLASITFVSPVVYVSGKSTQKLGTQTYTKSQNSVKKAVFCPYGQFYNPITNSCKLLIKYKKNIDMEKPKANIVFHHHPTENYKYKNKDTTSVTTTISTPIRIFRVVKSNPNIKHRLWNKFATRNKSDINQKRISRSDMRSEYYLNENPYYDYDTDYYRNIYPDIKKHPSGFQTELDSDLEESKLDFPTKLIKDLHTSDVNRFENQFKLKVDSRNNRRNDLPQDYLTSRAKILQQDRLKSFQLEPLKEFYTNPNEDKRFESQNRGVNQERRTGFNKHFGTNPPVTERSDLLKHYLTNLELVLRTLYKNPDKDAHLESRLDPQKAFIDSHIVSLIKLRPYSVSENHSAKNSNIEHIDSHTKISNKSQEIPCTEIHENSQIISQLMSDLNNYLRPNSSTALQYNHLRKNLST